MRLFLSTCSRSPTIRVPFQTSLPLPPRTRRIRRVFRVMLCSRIGGISVGWTQHWSDTYSNEPNNILWLNWFVEAPFLGYFSQIVAIHHGIHPPSSGQLQQSRKGAFLCSAYRYSAYRYSAMSNLFARWGVDLDCSIPWSTSQINAKFQEMIPCRPWEVLFHLGSLASKICPTIAYRWLFPDSQVSIKTVCSAVINSPKFCCSRYGFTCGSLAWSPSSSGPPAFRNFGLSGSECEFFSC